MSGRSTALTPGPAPQGSLAEDSTGTPRPPALLLPCLALGWVDTPPRMKLYFPGTPALREPSGQCTARGCADPGLSQEPAPQRPPAFWGRRSLAQWGGHQVPRVGELCSGTRARDSELAEAGPCRARSPRACREGVRCGRARVPHRRLLSVTWASSDAPPLRPLQDPYGHVIRHSLSVLTAAQQWSRDVRAEEGTGPYG